MPTIAEQLTQLESDRQDLVSNLQTKGITGLTGDETFTELVPEVLNIQTGGGSSDLDKLIDGSITSVTSDVANIRQYAFRGCSNLQEVVLTNSNFGTISNSSFGGTALTKLYIYSTTVATLANTAAFTGILFTVYVPSNLISSYQTATNWSTLYNNGRITFVAIS